jgi:hypothetical protein
MKPINMRTLILIIIAMVPLTSMGQFKKELKLKDFEFESIFGYEKGDSINLFCLLGGGYSRAPRSQHTDAIIEQWIKEHPEAIVLPVTLLGNQLNRSAGTKIAYCWIIDKTDTLNNHLVRQGCFTGNFMKRPKDQREMEREEKKLYKGIVKPKVVILVDQKSYELFLDQIRACERIAEQNKSGLWAMIED